MNLRVLLKIPIFFFGLLSAALVTSACDFFKSRSPGEKLWRQHCASCHGLDGRGNTPRYMGNPAADLTDDYWKHVQGNRYGWEQAIREGIPGAMAPNEQLSDEEVRLLLNYLSELRGETF